MRINPFCQHEVVLRYLAKEESNSTLEDGQRRARRAPSARPINPIRRHLPNKRDSRGQQHCSN